MHLRAHGTHLNGTHFCRFIETIAGDGTGDERRNFAHGRVIGAQHRSAIKRHAVKKIYKCFFQIAKVMPISFHVVGINVGDHCHHRQQIEKRGIGLISFHHDVVAGTQLGVSASTIEPPANDKSGV